MKLIDKNGKLFSKVSILDIVIVVCLVFLAVIFVAGRTGNLKVPVAKTNTEYVTRLKAYNVEKTEKSPFTEGCELYSSNGEYIGKVTTVECVPMLIKEKLNSGVIVDLESATAYDYYITVEGTGTVSDKGTFAQGTFALYPNNAISVTSKYFCGNVVVLSVEKKV